MKLAIGLLLAAGLGAAEPPAPNMDSGGALLISCQFATDLSPGAKPGDYSAGHCMGMIEGVAFTLEAAQIGESRQVYCPPNGLTATERLHAVIRYLTAHKTELSKPSRAYWVATALMGVYPCE